MNLDPDYSAAYCIVETDAPAPAGTPGAEEAPEGRLVGHGLAFTIGRGNEVVCRAIEALAASVVIGQTLESFIEAPGKFWERVVRGDSQIRWVGPEKGAVHLAGGALINALWDLWGKKEGKPVWRLFADLSPERKLACISFRDITDAITPDEALAIFREAEEHKAERIARLESAGLPAYVTSAGWIGLDDATVTRLVGEAVEDMGMRHIKIKVGRDLADDVRRCALVRRLIGDERFLMIDANQVWEVPQAIEWMHHLAPYKPWWIEEPVHPDDVLGHKAVRDAMKPLGVGVATGEMCANRVIFKNFLRADAIDFVQIDSSRLAGVNEVIAVLLMAHKYRKPICPHAGGVGLCEFVNHLAAIDFVCVTGSVEGKVVEFVDHLHEHFHDPCAIKDGAYIAPSRPGYSSTMRAASLDEFEFPHGPVWTEQLAAKAAKAGGGGGAKAE